MRASFTGIRSGLTIGLAPWRADGDAQWPQDKLIGFTLAGEDRVWHDADAKIEDEGVIVSSPPSLPLRRLADADVVIVNRPSSLRGAWMRSSISS